MDELAIKRNTAEFLLYTTPNGNIKIEVFLHDKNIWMPQKRMAELFGVNIPAISKHLANIFETKELEEKSVISILETTAGDGKTYQTKFYNLDAIIAVWYRVNSHQATQFRIWASNVLKEYILKGFVLDDERLKNWTYFDENYFNELLERIREIRASERRFYQKVTDIYATSMDYSKDSELTKEFFATVQNKLHYAVSRNTAAEIIYERVDSEKDHMWLSTRKYAPQWKIIKSDVTIAKNYLTEPEIQKLNLLVSAYLDIAEIQTMNRELMTMKDRKERLDEFLKLGRQEILEWAGKITAELAKEKAEKEYETFRPRQDALYMSDFDDFVKRIEKKK